MNTETEQINVYTEVGSIYTPRKDEYIFETNGIDLRFKKRLTNGFDYPSNSLSIISNPQKFLSGELAEIVTLKYISEIMAREYGNKEGSFNKMQQYISFANKYLNDEKQKVSFNYTRDDFTPDKIGETEEKFKQYCMDLANMVTMQAKAEMDRAINEQLKDSNNEINDVVASQSVFSGEINSFTGVTSTINDASQAQNIASSDEIVLDEKTLLEYLDTQEQMQVQEMVAQYIELMNAIKIVYNRKVEIRTLLQSDPNLSLDDAIKIYIDRIKNNNGLSLDADASSLSQSNSKSNEKAKVKVKTPNAGMPSHGEAAYIDTIILCLIAQLTIFVLLMGVLMLIK